MSKVSPYIRFDTRDGEIAHSSVRLYAKANKYSGVRYLFRDGYGRGESRRDEAVIPYLPAFFLYVKEN